MKRIIREYVIYIPMNVFPCHFHPIEKYVIVCISILSALRSATVIYSISIRYAQFRMRKVQRNKRRTGVRIPSTSSGKEKNAVWKIVSLASVIPRFPICRFAFFVVVLVVVVPVSIRQNSIHEMIFDYMFFCIGTGSGGSLMFPPCSVREKRMETKSACMHTCVPRTMSKIWLIDRFACVRYLYLSVCICWWESKLTFFNCRCVFLFFNCNKSQKHV